MSEENLPNTAINTENENNPAEVKVKKINVGLAVCLNFLAPGMGLLYLGKIKAAICVGLLWAAIISIIISVPVFLPILPSIIIMIVLSNIITGSLVAYTVLTYLNDKKRIESNKINIAYYILFFFAYTCFSPFLAKVNVEAYRIPTGSMEKSLLVGDFIMARKNYYGLVIPYVNIKLFSYNSPERNEVVIFNKFDPGEKTVYIKRVIGVPGDTIMIRDKIVFISGRPEKSNDNYIYDKVKREPAFYNPRIYPNGAHWNEDEYGPLYIPKKDEVIKINAANIMYWKELIAKDSKNSSGKFISDVVEKGEYKFEENYYFVMGDNRNNSYDSRFIGLIPEEDIIGKPAFIYFSKVNLFRIGNIVE
jgi:signal peptidase I